MKQPESIEEFLDQVRRGEPRAMQELFTRYAHRLAAIAEQHLSRRVARRLDGEDVVQSVFRTFVRRCRDGQFRLDSPGHLWRLLLTITLAKARAAGRRHTAGMRDVRAESPGASEGLEDALTREPGPDEAAALIDQIENLLCGLPDSHGTVLALRLEGHTPSEIARDLGTSRQTVYRVLHLFQRRLSEAMRERLE